jgi:alpha-L-arabinofuranosidase
MSVLLSPTTGTTLTFAVVNPSDSEQHIKLSVKDATLASRGHVWRIAPESVDATINVGQKPRVQVQEQELMSLPEELAVAPFSVNIYSFARQ